jgi:hypothetical protein
VVLGFAPRLPANRENYLRLVVWVVAHHVHPMRRCPHLVAAGDVEFGEQAGLGLEQHHFLELLDHRSCMA